MAQVSYGTITVSDLTDITDVYLEYAKVVDTVVRYQDIPSATEWSEIYPEWESGYQIWIRQVTKKEGLPDEYGTPYLDKAVNQTNYTINALDSKLKTFFWPGDSRYSGAYAVSKIPNINLDASDIETYGYNVGIRPAYVTIGYNATPVIQLDGTDGSLNIYQLPIIDNNTKMVTQSGALAMKLTGDALNFYGSNQSIPDSYLGIDGLITTKGIIGGWMIDPTSLHTINKNSWNDNQKGIYIGTYLDEAGNNSYVIAGGPNTESKGRDGGLETTPYWYIKDDGSAKFGEMTLTSGGLLSVPAASVSGTLTSSQINVNDLAAISANIGATVGQGSLTNTLGVSIEKEYILSTDTRVNPLKTYYTKNLDTGEFIEAEYNLIDNDNPSSEYKITDDIVLEPGNSVRFRKTNESETILNSEEFTGLQVSTFLENLLNGMLISIIPTADVDYESITRIVCEIGIYNDSSDKSIYEDMFTVEKYNSSLANSSIQVHLNNEALEDESLTALINNNIENVEASGGFLVDLSDAEELNDILADVLENSEETDNCTFDFYLHYDYETFPRYKQYYQIQVGSIDYTPIDYVTDINLNPHDNNYYEIEPWYEKVDSSYITLESHKNVYLLTNDEEIRPNVTYYEYSIEYGLTEDAEKKENKDYYISNNRNIYILTNDTNVIKTDEDILKNYFTIQLTQDITFLEGKDYCELIVDESGGNVYRVVEISQKNQSPISLGYYEANKIENLQEGDVIGSNWYESQYYSWYSKIENKNITDPSLAGWFEQIISYKPAIISSGANPKALNLYTIEDQYNVQLKLKNAQMDISSNNVNLFTIKSEEENDINIANMEITSKLKIGNLELIPFNNGLAIQAKGGVSI